MRRGEERRTRSREGKRRGVRRETMSGGSGDEIGGRWGILWEKEGSTGRGCAVVSASRRTAGDECEQNKTSRDGDGCSALALQPQRLRDEAMGAVV